MEELKTKVWEIREILAKQTSIMEKVSTITEDHENRIRGLEQYKYYAIAALSIVLTLANFVFPFIRK